MFTVTKSLVTPLFLTVLATLAGKVSHCFLLLFSYSYSSITTKQPITGWLQLAAQNLLRNNIIILSLPFCCHDVMIATTQLVS
jgi:hypothetical protein